MVPRGPKNVKNKAKMGSKPQNPSYIMMAGHWDPETPRNDLMKTN